MQSSGFFDRLANSFKSLSEGQGVEHYKKTSTVYKNAVAAANKPNVRAFHKNKMRQLSEATSFEDMLAIAKHFRADENGVAIKYANLAFCAVAGFFSDLANFGYYAMDLHEDISKYAIQFGYMKPEEPEITFSL